METARVLLPSSHWLMLRQRGGPNRGRSRVVQPDGGGGYLKVTCSSHFFFSSHPNPPGVRGGFQELSFATVEPATPKMEAPCAAIKREPSELFLLRLHSPSQDGRLGSRTPPATPDMAPWSRRSGLSMLREVTHTARFRFFFCRKNSWLLG